MTVARGLAPVRLRSSRKTCKCGVWQKAGPLLDPTGESPLATASSLATKALTVIPSNRRQPPLDRRFAILLQKLVGPAEVSATEEAAISGQRRRMHRRQHQMLRSINELLLALGMRAPQHEHQMRLMFADHFNDPIGEKLPALVLVRIGVRALDGHGGVDHQHTLFSPALQAAVARDVDVQ